MKLQYKDKTASKRQVYTDLSAIIIDSVIDSVTEWGFTDYSITPYDVFYHHGEIALEAKDITVVLRETGNYSYELTVS